MKRLVDPKILIVDDEPDTCSGLRDILQMDGYEVDIAHSIADMFGARDWSDYFVIILDRKLPDGMIEDVLPDLKTRAPNASIIIVTGYGDLESTITALRHGVEDYLIKPINADAFRATIDCVNRNRLAKEHALQTERLAAIGEVVTSMAHECRNFLQRICSATDFLVEIDKDNSEALEEVRRIKNAEKGLEHLLEEVRHFAAPINLDKEYAFFPDVWRRAWSSVTHANDGNGARIDEIGIDDNVVDHIDTFRFEQVFRNIFQNSLAACDKNLRVTIDCQRHGGKLKISVRDNGPGLGPEQREKVFHAFYTTKAKGTGLGMAIVKRIVEAHGGTISIGDDASSGAEFVITLPLER